jgi:conjugal transfer/type IV secretion protein DotA/TraY
MDASQITTGGLVGAANQASGFDPGGAAGVSAEMMLKMIFGDIAGDPLSMLTSLDSGGTVLSLIFMYINVGLLTLGSVYLTYKTLAAVTQTAHDGDFIGKAFHTVWVPIRVTTGVLSLVPIAGGWNALQVVMLWIGVMGAGLGNMAWQDVVGNWMNTGVVQQVNGGAPVNSGKKTNVAATIRFGNSSLIADKVFEALLCDEAYRQSAVYYSEGSGNGADGTNLPLTDFSDSKIAIFNSTGVECGSVSVAGQGTIKPDSLTREDTPFSKIGIGDTLAQQVEAATKGITLSMIGDMRSKAHDAVAEVVKNLAAARDPANNLNVPKPDLAKYIADEKLIGATYQAQISGAVSDILNSAAKQDKMSGIIMAAAKNYGFVSAGSFYTAYANSSYAIKGAGDSDGMVDVTVNKDNHTDTVYTSTMNYYEAARTKTSVAGSKPGDSDSEQGAFRLLKDKMGFGSDNLINIFIRHDNTAPALVNIKNTADNVVTFAGVGVTAIGAIEGLMNKSVVGLVAGLTPLGAGAEGAIAPWLEMAKFVMEIALGFFLMCSIYLPLVPYIVFMGQVMEWLVSVMEGVAAAPFLAFAHFDTDGEGLGQRTSHGYSFMLQSFMRPVMLILAFVLASAMIEVSIYFLTATYGFAVADAQVHSITGIFAIFGYCALYMVLAVGLVNTSCSLMYKLPDAIFEFMGVRAVGTQFGRDTAGNAAQTFLGNAAIVRSGTGGMPKAKSGQSADPKPKDGSGAHGTGGGAQGTTSKV